MGVQAEVEETESRRKVAEALRRIKEELLEMETNLYFLGNSRIISQ